MDLRNDTFTYRAVRVTKIMGSSSDDRIYQHFRYTLLSCKWTGVI
jgi:hypothetical protein